MRLHLVPNKLSRVELQPPKPMASGRAAIRATIAPARAALPRSPRMPFTMSAPTSSSSPADWNAANYLRFGSERTRAARDLLAAIPPLRSPSPRIVDLGCGPANSTSLLAARYGANASITGVDSSPNMLDRARHALPAASFELGDLRTYEPGGEVDLLYSNAALHWLPDEELLPRIQRWIGGPALASGGGGVFAMQVPDNVREPSHALMTRAWTAFAREGDADPGRRPFPPPRAIYDALSPLCESVDVWRTAYYHRLDGHEAIVAWLKESGLRPFLEAVGEERREAFLQRYLEEIREAYPLNADGSVLLKFPRLFVVCVKK
ncbi:putative trans-aconitate 2-methyltransferase [Macrophomina phaseolina]|uniref:Trans-aconitate 2-methyltransferase n=1 Tax=Macrophomina phaseolina TaxID=35725 RepID=A0ABQ8GHX6_9PEZI|nr:putative trans-aconitate 2-methyltransferase [Macrophomina phaseolina]